MPHRSPFSTFAFTFLSVLSIRFYSSVRFVFSASAPISVPTASSVCPFAVSSPESFVQTSNGTCNNQFDPTMGSNNGFFSRLTPPAYCVDDDGQCSGTVMAGCHRPNPRLISNVVLNEPDAEFIPDPRGLNFFIVMMGQFFTHESHASGNKTCNPALPAGSCIVEPLAINVTNCGGLLHQPDPLFVYPIPSSRNAYGAGTGSSTSNPRVMLDTTTFWIDASNVYGARPELTAQLRSYEGGRLKSQLLPAGEFPWYLSQFSVSGQLVFFNEMNPVQKPASGMFACGDQRCNENVGVLSVHVIFLREHQYWAGNLSVAHPDWDDEQIFQQARRIVRSELQKFIAYEYWPVITGLPTPAYPGYNESFDGRPTLEMVFAAWKIGHSQLTNDVAKRNLTTGEIVATLFKDTYFKPEYLTARKGDLEEFIYGSITRSAQNIDVKIVNALRNFLFGIPMGNMGGIDLASLNIMRLRDVGMMDYNSVRVALGLANHTSFSAISSDPEVQANLAGVYNDRVDDIDLWVGGLAEDHVEHSPMGELFQYIFMDHIHRIRTADRFWFEISGNLDPSDQKNDEALRQLVFSTSVNDVLLRCLDIPANVLPNPDRIFYTETSAPQNSVNGLPVSLPFTANITDTPFEENNGEPEPLDQNMISGTVINSTSGPPSRANGASSKSIGPFIFSLPIAFFGFSYWN